MATKRILIVSYHFHPGITPRAFRAFELAKALVRKGHAVDVVTARMDDVDYPAMEREHGFAVTPIAWGPFRAAAPGTPASALAASQKPRGGLGARIQRVRAQVESALQPALLSVLPSPRAAWFTLPVASHLVRRRGSFDALISLSFPPEGSIGSALALAWRGRVFGTAIYELSDPITGSASLPRSPLYPLLDRFLAKHFDFLVTPSPTAVTTYERFMPRERIRVIPQGIDFSQVRRKPYAPNPVPTFAYAGGFYRIGRYPKRFLEFLASSPRDFRFVMLTDTRDADTMDLLAPYREALGERLVLRHLLPRLECIAELSGCDFLINIHYDTGGRTRLQIPSKLIDYGLAGRPIYSFAPDQFTPEAMTRFLDNDYTESLSVDISPFEAGHVAEQFLELVYAGRAPAPGTRITAARSAA